MDKIAEAEATLADYRAHYMDVGAPELAEVLSPLIALAKDQRDELARLKAPLGDEGRELVRRARWREKDSRKEVDEFFYRDAADLIERQAAAMAAPVGDVEAREHLQIANEYLEKEKIKHGSVASIGWTALVRGLCRIVRSQARQLAAVTEALEVNVTAKLKVQAKLAALTKGVEAARRELQWSAKEAPAREVCESVHRRLCKSAQNALAILDQHVPAQEVGDATP